MTAAPACGSPAPHRGDAGFVRAAGDPGSKRPGDTRLTLPAGDAGFTLIEALVAMAVLAVAATGFVRATSGHIDTIARLETRAAGGWAADNALAEARLGRAPAAAMLLGRTWQPAVAARGSDDPDIAAVTVSVDGGGARVAVRGFRDTAALASAAVAR